MSLTCIQIRPLAPGREAGALERGQASAFDEHLDQCPACARVYRLFVDSTCRWMTDFLADYLEHALPADERAAFEWHLDACPACRSYLASYSATLRAARASAVELPQLPPELVQAILAARRRQ